MEGSIISQFKENGIDPDKLLHNSGLFEEAFFLPYIPEAAANDDDDHHSDHAATNNYNAETMVEEMYIADAEMPYHPVNHDDDDDDDDEEAAAVNANLQVEPPSPPPTGNYSCNAETQGGSLLVDIDGIDWGCLFEAVNSETASQEEGEPAGTKQLLTPFNDNDNNSLEYLDKFLNGETAQETIHETNCKTKPTLKRCYGGGGGGGGDNNVKKWTLRKRYKKGSAEDAQRKEEYKIKNRISAAKSFERKQAYIRQLEIYYQILHKENAFLKNWLKFHGTMGINSRATGQSKLQRSISGTIE